MCQEPPIKQARFTNNGTKEQRYNEVESFETLAGECLRLLKSEFRESFYTNFGADEKKKLQQRLDEFFDHSVYGGKMTRSRLSFAVFQALKGSTVVEPKAAMKVILSIELLQAVFLVVDDIMDSSDMRRGKPCWYKVPHIGFAALNHALRLQNFVNIAISDAIPSHYNLSNILRIVWETIQITSDGQELDGFSVKACDSTFERYSQIVANKTSRYTFYHPITIGLLLANENSHFDKVLELSEKLGYFFQAQDDLLDFLDNDEATGKTSCDIREGKCTWFSCKTMEKLTNNPEKKRKFEEAYGSSDPERISEAKRIMEELKLLEDFNRFQSVMIVDINNLIADFPLEKIKPALQSIFKSLINRKK